MPKTKNINAIEFLQQKQTPTKKQSKAVVIKNPSEAIKQLADKIAQKIQQLKQLESDLKIDKNELSSFLENYFSQNPQTQSIIINNLMITDTEKFSGSPSLPEPQHLFKPKVSLTLKSLGENELQELVNILGDKVSQWFNIKVVYIPVSRSAYYDLSLEVRRAVGKAERTFRVLDGGGDVMD